MNYSFKLFSCIFWEKWNNMMFKTEKARKPIDDFLRWTALSPSRWFVCGPHLSRISIHPDGAHEKGWDMPPHSLQNPHTLLSAASVGNLDDYPQGHRLHLCNLKFGGGGGGGGPFSPNSQLPSNLQTLAFQPDAMKKQIAESLQAGPWPCQLPPLLTSFAGGGILPFLGRGFRTSRGSQVERVHCVDATLWSSWVDLEWIFPLLSQNSEQGERNHASLVASIPKMI